MQLNLVGILSHTALSTPISRDIPLDLIAALLVDYYNFYYIYLDSFHSGA
jgi:hypothetical protein